MKLLSTFLRDLKVSYRSYYIYIEFIMAFLIVAILLFVVPENSNATGKMYLYVEGGTQEEMIQDTLERDGTSEVFLLTSREAVEAALEEDRSAQGAVLSMKGEVLHYEILLQGYESDKLKHLLSQVLQTEMKKAYPAYVSQVEMKVLDHSAERLSDRISYLPLLLLLNSAFMGLFVVAAYVFMDKDEGTIKALTVTPVSIKEYLLAKVGVMLLTGLLTGLATALLVAGSSVHVPLLFILLAAANFFGTALGLFIASFYDSIIKAMGALYVVIMVLAFGSISYFMPSFSPLFIRLLPSYPLLFAFREVFLQAPDSRFVLLNVGGFFLLGVLFFILANHRYKKTLTV